MDMKFALAKATVEKGKWDKGTTCPCCGQFCKVYRIPFYRSLANEFRDLVGLSEASSTGYVHVKAIHNQDHNVCKARHWGIVEQDPKRRGWWRVTTFGFAFAKGEAKVVDAVFLYNNECVGKSKKMLSISDALGGVPYELSTARRALMGDRFGEHVSNVIDVEAIDVENEG